MEKKQPIIVPMIALRGLSIFPGMAISFPAGRQKSLDALQAAEENGKEIIASLNHKFLCNDGIIRRLEEIIYTDLEIVMSEKEVL
jgi:ATP-dependent Lon protease